MNSVGNMKRWMLGTVVALFGTAALSAEITVGAGETHALTADENVTATVFKLADTATLVVPADIAWLNCSIDVTEGTATLDATAVTESLGMGAVKPTYLRTLGGEGCRLVVKGKDALSFGRKDTASAGQTNVPTFDADVAFVQADGNAFGSPVGVTFVNNVLIRRVPVSSPYAVGDGAIILLGGSNPLGLEDELSLTAWNLQGPIHPTGGLPNETDIVVGPACAFYVRGVTTGDGTSSWGRWSPTFANNVTVNGTMEFHCPWSSASGGTMTFSGAIDGNGLIKGADATSDIVFSGDVAFDGELRCGTIGKVTFRTAARIGTLTAALSTTVVIKDDLDVGTLAGPLVLTAASTGMLHVARLAAGASITIPESVKLRIDAVEDEAAHVTLVGESGTYSIAGPASPTAAAVKYDLAYPAGDVALTLGGRIATEPFPASVKGVSLAEDCDWMPPLKPESSDWRDKANFWLDADNMSSMLMASNYSKFVGLEDKYYFRGNTVGGRPLVFRWSDWREDVPGTRYNVRNMRTNTDPTTFKSYGGSLLPALAVNDTVNNSGRHYMDISAYMATASTLYDDFNTGAVRSEYAITVFGSQSGGGRALFGNSSGAFNRSGYGNSAAKATTYNIATNAFETYVNGSAVDPTVTTFDGGWQIVSMKTEGNSISGFGFGGDVATDRGYVNYAEVIVFSEELTERERKIVEKYLSDKWDIAISHGGVEPLPQELTLSGTGTITLTADTTVHGTFCGTVNVNGFELKIADDGNLREATPCGMGSITAATYRQLPKRDNCGGFVGTMVPPPPGLLLIVR